MSRAPSRHWPSAERILMSLSWASAISERTSAASSLARLRSSTIHNNAFAASGWWRWAFRNGWTFCHAACLRPACPSATASRAIAPISSEERTALGPFDMIVSVALRCGQGWAVAIWTRLNAVGLYQLHPLQARMPVLADDDMIVHGNAERGGDVDDRPGHLDVGLRRRRIAGRVVVHQDQRGRRQFQRALDHLARVDRGVIDGADLLHLV